MKRYQIQTRGRKLCDMVNNVNTQKHNKEESIENNDNPINHIENIDLHDSSFRSIQESPYPVNFNESEIIEVADIIGEDFFETTLDTDTATDHPCLDTAHPSPECSINHLDYGCEYQYTFDV